MKRITTAFLGSALLLGSAVASAETPQFPERLIGSDTLNQVMDNLFATLLGNGQLTGTGYTSYSGLGSSQGERQLAGSPNAGEPTCSPLDGDGAPENNEGCQEISPMSRPLASGICDDDIFENGVGGSGTSNTEAEGLAVCADGIVIVTDNLSFGQYGDSVADCNAYSALSDTSNTGNSFPDRKVGNLRKSGIVDLAGPTDYTIGGGTLTAATAWKDVLRLIYTGCDNTSLTCAGSNNRVARCNSEVRNKLLQDWSLIFSGVDCGAAGNNCNNASTPGDGGLRQAYRRDDTSGTTGVFLELLGVLNVVSANLLTRTTLLVGPPLSITPMPNNGSFCDGGQVEGFFPTNVDGGVPKFDLGDPIRKPCKAEDDLCAFDGKMPVVRPIRSTVQPDPLDALSGYPKYQCKLGAFERKTYIPTSLPVCPDGTVPLAGACNFPFYEGPAIGGGTIKTFDCLNQKDSRPATVPGSVDGRAYNFVMHQQDGTVRLLSGSLSSAMPQVASWRQNMAEINTAFAARNGFAYGPGSQGAFVCTENDSTRNIGCIVGKTTCTVGYAGREGAFTTANNHHLFSEPAQIDEKGPTNAEIGTFAYPFSRNLFLNATRGFENLTTDCLNRGGSAAHCADELRIAQEFYNVGAPGNLITQYCTASGYIPLDEAVCVGAQGTAGCGKPASQLKTACLPQ